MIKIEMLDAFWLISQGKMDVACPSTFAKYLDPNLGTKR